MIRADGQGLTMQEAKAIETLGQVWNQICDIVGHGASRDGDLNEAIAHVHALQHFVMAQAAARAHPNSYRLLGEVL